MRIEKLFMPVKMSGVKLKIIPSDKFIDMMCSAINIELWHRKLCQDLWIIDEIQNPDHRYDAKNRRLVEVLPSQQIIEEIRSRIIISLQINGIHHDPVVTIFDLMDRRRSQIDFSQGIVGGLQDYVEQSFNQCFDPEHPEIKQRLRGIIEMSHEGKIPHHSL